jgi:hypothetical protein
MNSDRSLSKLKINLYGENRIIRKVLLSEEDNFLFKKVADKMEQPMCQALVDPFFYYLLKKPKINSLEDLNCDYWDGLINNSKNQIEIWFQNKKMQKCKIDLLIDELLLFPLFQTSKIASINVSEPGFYIEQKEVGLVNSFELMLEKFDINQLLFEISNFENTIHLSGLKYEGIKISKKRKDSVITYQNGFIIY